MESQLVTLLLKHVAKDQFYELVATIASHLLAQNPQKRHSTLSQPGPSASGLLRQPLIQPPREVPEE